MKEILNKFLNLSKNTRILAIVGLSCSFICIFLTYIKYTVLGLAVKIKLIDFLEGKLMILLILLNLMFIFKDYVKKYLPKLFENNVGRKIYNINDQRWTLIPIGLTIIFAFVVKGETKTEFLNTTFGLGFYLMWLGVISLIAHAFMYKNDKIKPIETKVVNNVQNNQSINIANEMNVQSANTQEQKNEPSTTINQSIAEPQIPTQNPTPNVEAQITTKYCTNCGTKCEFSAVKCPACGKDF